MGSVYLVVGLVWKTNNGLVHIYAETQKFLKDLQALFSRNDRY